MVTVSQPIGSSSCGHLKCSLYPRSAVTHLATWHTAASQSIDTSNPDLATSRNTVSVWFQSNLQTKQVPKLLTAIHSNIILPLLSQRVPPSKRSSV